MAWVDRELHPGMSVETEAFAPMPYFLAIHPISPVVVRDTTD